MRTRTCRPRITRKTASAFASMRSGVFIANKTLATSSRCSFSPNETNPDIFLDDLTASPMPG